MSAISAMFPQAPVTGTRGKPATKPPVPPLVNGDTLTQPEFHRRYEAMPPETRAELIGGIVYMASPLRARHGIGTYLFSAVFAQYQAATPGVQGMDNATAILAQYSEPQPDVVLRLLPEFGGRTKISEKDFLTGPPELIVEVAQSSAAIDLRVKKEDYQRAGVREYLVLCVAEQELRAFDLQADQPLSFVGSVYRSAVFPGLWIDVSGVLAGDASKVLRTAGKGLKSADHADFVKKQKALLRASKKRKK